MKLHQFEDANLFYHQVQDYLLEDELLQYIQV